MFLMKNLCDASLTFFSGTNKYRLPEIKLGSSANYQEVDMKLLLLVSKGDGYHGTQTIRL